MNSGLPGLLLGLLFLLNAATEPSVALSPKLEHFIENLFDVDLLKEEFDSLESIKTLSASNRNKTRQLSLTQGGGNLETYKMHQSAMAMLSAVYKVQNSELSEDERNQVMLTATMPAHYCPGHDYYYYKCDEEFPYRKIDGSCNNLYIPWWGKTLTPYDRLFGQAYDDNYNSPRTKSTARGYRLPNARTVAMKIHSARRSFPTTTEFFTFFGQHVDHDLVFTARASDYNGEEVTCQCGSSDPDCFNIPVPEYDYYNKDQQCLPFTRSSAAYKHFDCHLSHREQVNMVTHWLDLSNIYGSDDETAFKLREGQNGRLKVSTNPATGHDDLPRDSAHSCPVMKSKQKCFMTGDDRAEDNYNLAFNNKLWVLEHNKWAGILENRYGWDDERTYQVARKIVIAEYQKIIYEEWLPILLGSEAMEKWKLNPDQYDGYDKDANPQVKNAYATAAARFGHVLINKFHYIYNEYYDLVNNYTTNNMLFKYQEHPDWALRGSLLQNSYHSSPAINDYLNNYLFQGLSDNYKRHSLGALNIQRGRDHGLPGYCHYRVWCEIDAAPATQFSDFAEIPEHMRDELAKLYYTPCDVDLFTGMMSELAVEDGVLGPTAACIIGEGFHSWKFGDRFFFTNTDNIAGFTEPQIEEIRSKVTMSSIICDNSDMYVVQRNPFLEASGGFNDLVECKTLPDVDPAVLLERYDEF